jgi:GNAT superfamily N-acetyltransferase
LLHEKTYVKEQVYSADRIVGLVLRKLPDYFGSEAAILGYCKNARMPAYKTFVASGERGQTVGFAMLVMNNSMTAELWVMGVVPDFHGHGVGSSLVARLETEARKRGARYMMVKTIGPSQKDANFLRTFSFYLMNGYAMVVEYDNIWKGDQCAILVKKL